MVTTPHLHSRPNPSAKAPPNPHLADEGLSVPEDAIQRPGQMPPAESGVSDLDGPEREPLSRGWAAAPITLIMIVVALFVAGFLGWAIELMV
ncbi:hypothetical protein SAMN05216223_10671 [Actinacidiphila yanglinensis]|uniref:Uncharacterized protein n=1 Tax=Actinacidiphila yanglinensis TaxID=310779 RepID=A0A1H6AYV4_9ACTN|nr:DUF6480 family protein [Actinacidiphila yanglinensis]SEG53592.1 hypothetical protein SAMN05216223_10671 [Actinacidiphila yanglinensis]